MICICYRLLYFDTPIEFEHAAIGQAGLVPQTDNNFVNEIASMTSFEKSVGCMKEGSFTLEPSAVKFGDNPHSYVHVEFGKRHNMQKNFKMDFRFRSFYPNGLIFMLMVTIIINSYITVYIFWLIIIWSLGNTRKTNKLFNYAFIQWPGSVNF